MRFSKYFTQSLLSVVMGITLLTGFLGPLAVHAQTDPAADASLQTIVANTTVVEPAKKKIQDSLVGSVFTYLVNLMTFAADRAAYDAATRIASGGPAGDPLYDGTPAEQYFKEYGAAVAGESIGLLQDQLEASGGTLGAIFSGFDLCQPRANITIALNLGIKGVFDRPTPKCDFKSIQSNWKGFVADIQDEGSADNKNKIILTQLADAFDPSTNEFAVGITLQSSIINKALSDAGIKTTTHISESGFQPVANFITGNEDTPASLIDHDFMQKGDNVFSTRTQIAWAVLTNTDALLQVGVHAGSVFTNTLLSELTQKLYSGLFEASPKVDPFADVNTIATTTAQDARDQFRSLLAFTPLEITNYSILADFSSCPSGAARGLYNCVADNSFVSAIGRADAGAPLTISEAIDEGLLDGNWPLIPSSDLARDQDPFCYTYGYCHSNLVKLRKARVISIGWELAAESIYNSPTDTVTLQEVIDGFNNCNAAGQADTTHPWCKLIDPNWILKYPETQCKQLVNGQLLVSSASDERQQECVDMPSCIAENDDGTCTGGYGYCVAEENIWRFRGESCPAQYASCLTFTGDDKTVSYLQNTVDFSNCSADNAGCLWYSTEKADPEGDGTYDWQPVADVAAADAAPDAYTTRDYFTSAVEGCTAENGGCSQLYERDDSLRLNVVQNPGFEDDTNADSVADAWQRSDTSVVLESSGASRTGTNAIDLGATTSLTQVGVAVSQGRFYTVSFYARQKADGGTGVAQASLAFLASTPGNDIDLDGTSFVGATGSNCTVGNSGSLVNGDGLSDVLNITGTPTGTGYERYSCTFTSPRVTDAAALITASLTLSGSVYMDDVQLEQGESASVAHVAYSSTDIATITVKVPPAYLGCTGEDTDPPACADYAQVCSENDVGCTAYTPDNGDPTVTGVASELDACPATCVGYDTFMQEPTLYEPAGSFPVYFIPDSGDTCSAEDVGCDEFTNLSNENLEYYTSLRSCLTPTQAALNTTGDNAATFYTWEGSDLAGYQLKTWDLLESNMGHVTYTYVSGGTDSSPDLAPCSLWTTTADGIVCSDALDSDNDLHKDWDTAACDDHEDIFTNPDCREFYDTNGGIHYREWSKTVTVSDSCVAYRKTELVGNDLTEQTANCTNSGGYYDAATGSCRYNGLADESLSCSAAANGCRAYTGGRSRNSRLVLEDELESGTLSNWDAASAADVTLSNESLATGGHSIAATGAFSSFIFDNGTTCSDPAGCPGTAQALGGDCTVVDGQQFCGTLEDELFQGKTYTLSFWAKGSGNLTVGFDMGAVPGSPEAEVIFGTVALTSGWQQFSLGPLDMTAAAYPSFGKDTTLAFVPTALSYIDNISLREGEDSITLIKNSWVTPSECDESPTGAASPQYYLGCQAYTTQDNQTADLKSFSHLCSSDKVGCQDFFQTHESDSPYAQVFKATCANPSGSAVTSPTSCYYETDGSGNFDTTSQYLCTIGVGQIDCSFDIDWYADPSVLPSHITYGPSTKVVPADSDAFLVVNDDVTCSSAYAGCTEIGKPDWSADRNSTTGATSVYVIDDPDTYSDTLCSQEELFCAAWDTDTKGTFYFKDPDSQTCDYETGVIVNGTSYDGWFRTGTTDFCYGTCSDGVTSCTSDAQCGSGTCDAQDPSYVINGTVSGVWNNGDDAYGGSVAQCPAEDSLCSEFQDPLDLQTNETYQVATGKQYFYLDNENLDENVLPDSQRCNGQVSLKAGCVLFNDTSEPSQGFNSSASQTLSTHADALIGIPPYSLVDPVNCESGDTTRTLADGTVVDLCAQRCIYDQGAVNDITDGVTRGRKLANEVTDADPLSGNAPYPDEYGFDDLYDVGTSCFDVSDCGTMRSESGQEIKALDCASAARVTRAAASPTGQEELTSVPRLENDTNTILKVNRDRQCSEWLSCAEDQASWDERTSTWKTVCSDVELCTKYSSVGGTTFCSQWQTDQPDLVLDDNLYESRDTSWYGQEYSGYAIPNLFPVQDLEQVNVAPPQGQCDLAEPLADGQVTQAMYDKYHGESCSSNADCDDNPNSGSQYCILGDYDVFRLALVAGTCDGEYATSCSVGYCENTGAACSTTTDCGTDGGTCLAGVCETDTGNACATDSNCNDGEVCSGATCVVLGDDVSVETLNQHPRNPDNSCPVGQIFAANTALQTGSCISGQCLLTPDGDTFDMRTTEGKICRAQPEVNSPFSNELVDRWLDPTTNQATSVGADPGDIDDTPYSVRSGFENANLCADGQACECTYDKLTFDNGEVRYWAPETPVDSTTGICSTGLVNQTCTEDSECDSTAGSGDGTCSLVKTENVMLGLQGYCLEKDSGININGDRDEHACLTWLPVDQLAGSTDLYAKATEAGYFNDTLACSYTAPYANLKMSNHPDVANPDIEASIACADSGSSITKSSADDEGILYKCATEIQCPVGYWALMGMPDYQANGGSQTMASSCAENALANNDCPFVCIPKGATTLDDNGNYQSCDSGDSYVTDTVLPTTAPTGFQYEDSFDGVHGADTDPNATLVKFIGRALETGNGADVDANNKIVYQEYDNTVAALQSCSLKGVEMTSDTETTLNFPSAGVPTKNTFYWLYMNAEYYPACKDAVRVSDAQSFSSYAWTNRLYGYESSFTSVDSPDPGLSFDATTAPMPYGYITTDPLSLDDNWPLAVAACQDKTTNDLTQPFGPGLAIDCTGTNQEPYTTGESATSHAESPSPDLQNKTSPFAGGALARSFVPFNYGFGSWDDPSAFTTTGNSDSVFAIVTQLFAGVPPGDNLYTWGGTDTAKSYTRDAFVDTAASDQRAEDGNPPSVWSLVSGSCVGTECKEGSLNTLTLNDQSSGDVSGPFFLRAFLKFYAGADKNQLPIRRVIVDWGDGEATADVADDMPIMNPQGSDADDNFYKNHRGLSATTDKSLCDLGGEWGETAESCDPNYFSYSHVYTCSPQILASDRACQYTTDGRVKNSPCWIDNGSGDIADRECVFQPRVHIRDNWGWCTGTCTAGADGTDGCYEGDTYDTLNSGNIDNPNSECGYAADNQVGGPVDPWVYYDGTVTVDPQ